MTRKRLAVFDCDGTLVDGQAAICDAMEAAFASARLPTPPRHEIRRIVGLSLPEAVRQLAPQSNDHLRAATVNAYKDAYRASRAARTLEERLYGGIAELLHTLRADGWQLAVATGKSDRGLETCLVGHHLRDLFVSLQTADRHPSKPDPAMLQAALHEAGATASDAVMIGDTSFDMAMAKAADVRAIGVTWGYHSRAELIESGASIVVDTMAELLEVLE